MDYVNGISIILNCESRRIILSSSESKDPHYRRSFCCGHYEIHHNRETSLISNNGTRQPVK